MSKPSIHTTQNIKAPNSAIPAQSAQSRISSWSRGPPAFASAATNPNPNPGIAPAPNVAAARSQPVGINGAPSQRAQSHSRKPSAYGAGPPSKDSVTMPKNIPANSSSTPLNFGSIGDANAQLPSSSSNVTPIAQSVDVKSFGSIRADPAPSLGNAPSKQSSNDTKQTPTPPPSGTSTPPPTKAAKRKVDVNALFQTSSNAGPPTPTSTTSPGPSSSTSFVRNGTVSPSISPRVRTGPLPNGGFSQMSPSIPHRQLQGGGPRSPQMSRNATLSGVPMAGPPTSRNASQSSAGGGPPQPNTAPMNSPRMGPNQLPQSPMMYYGFGPQMLPGQRIDSAIPQYPPYFYNAPDAYNTVPWYGAMSSMGPTMPPPPQQPQPPQQQTHQNIAQPIPPHTQNPPPMANSPRNPHLPPPPTSLPQAIPPNPPTPTIPSRSIPPIPPGQNATLSRTAPAFQPRSANRSSAITIKTPNGDVVDTFPSKSRPVSIAAPSHSRSASIAPSPVPTTSSLATTPETGEPPKKPGGRAPVRLETAEDREKRLKAEEDKKLQAEAEERAKKEAEAAAAAEAARIKAEEEAAQKAKEEAERKAKEEAQERERLRLLKEKEEEEAREAERLRIIAEEKAKKEAEEKARQAALEEEARRKAEEERAATEAAAARAAEEAREAEAAAAAAKAEAERAESESSMQQNSSPSTPEITPAKPTPLGTGFAGKRPTPGKLDLSGANAKNVTVAPVSALASARIIDDISKTSYPEGIKSPAPELNVNAPKGKFRYDRDFLVQFMKVCVEKPDSLPDLDTLGIAMNGESSALSRPQRQRTGSSMGPPNRAASAAGLSFSSSKSAFGGGMGNFTSAGAKSTSADRFAASNNVMSRSVSSAGIGRGGAVPLSRSSSQGGVGMLPHTPKDGHSTQRTRSSRGGRRDKPSAGPSSTSHFSSPSLPNATLEPVTPLERSENRWVPEVLGGGHTPASDPIPNNSLVVERKVKGLLNKLTMEKFDKLSDQILAWANKSEEEKDGATLILVIKLIFEKATDEAAWSEMYARLCRKMMEQISPNVQDDSVKNSQGQPIVGGQLFRKYLLNRCQEDFQRGWAVKESTAAAAAGKAADDMAQKAAHEGSEETVLYSAEYYAAEKAKRRGLGLVKFIGELFKLQMLTERIMHECIKQLLSNIENPEEEDIESLCRLLVTVGQAMDNERARDHMNVYFSRMAELVKNTNISSRIRFMVQDVIDMRARKWQTRNAVSAPSTIAQIHAEAAKDHASKERESYTRLGAPMSRGGSRRGVQRGEEATQDGWNVAGPGPSVTRVPNNLTNFGKIGKTTTAQTSSNPFDVYTKKGAKARDAAPTLPRAQSNANMFSALNPEAPADLPPTTPSSRAPSRKPSLDLGSGGVPEAPAIRKKLVLAPRTIPAEPTEGSVAERQEEGVDDGESRPVMTATQAESRIMEDIKEFWNGRNLEEARHYFTALVSEHRHLLVSKLASSALDKREDDVKLVAELFSSVAGELCAEETFETGLGGIVEAVDDLSVDVPKAYSFVARLLVGTRLPRTKVEELANKIIFDGDPLTPPPKKLTREYEKLL